MSETTVPVHSATTSAASAGPLTGRARGARVALRAVQVLLALFFGVASALPKLIAHPTAVESFDRIGWGGGAMYTIGALELAGAVALLVPMLQSVAAVALSGLMAGAFVVQLAAFDGQNAATPLILIVPLALIAWTRRAHTADLLRLLRRR
ncbi:MULTISPECIES: DoxX family protein [Streptomyces]|uniref:DoxX family protein n=1 Tax=Streptomyces tricolor TaxID=68277 RepID=A0ABS9JRW5_9ACTN|nr:MULTISPECIES: DoxX family protein [Streptomyces]MCG0068317.1 DoxX family protein [Streptomyces tricolor]OYP18202.1 DoxX family protein [Streptomyces sp. FBKL.4005]